MKIERKKLIGELLEMTERSTVTATEFKNLESSKLNYKNSPESWSILECLEHLNLYGDYYLPEIEKQMLARKPDASAMIFKSGILGNYFANLMRADQGKIKKMQSPKDKNPSIVKHSDATHSNLPITGIDRFLKQQELLKNLLIQAQNSDLTKTKTAISLSRMIRLRLGDTFRFFTYHIDRHIRQAEGVQPESIM